MKSFTLFILLLAFVNSFRGEEKNNEKLMYTLTKNSVSKLRENADTILTLLTYGLPNFERQNSRNVIAKKWGIRFYAVAGCVVTREFEDSVRNINKKVNQLIVQKFGAKWREKFEKEVDAEFEKEILVTTILDKVDFIRKKDELMNKEGNGLHYYMTPIENSTAYNVSVEGWGTINIKDAWVSFFRMSVNYKTKEYKLLDDNIELSQ